MQGGSSQIAAGGSVTQNIGNTTTNNNNDASHNIVINNITAPGYSAPPPPPQPMYIVPPVQRTMVQRIIHDSRSNLLCVLVVLILELITSVMLLYFYGIVAVGCNVIFLLLMNYGMKRGETSQKIFSLILVGGNLVCSALFLVAMIFVFTNPCVFPAHCDTPFEFLRYSPYWVYFMLVMISGICQWMTTLYTLHFAVMSFRGQRVDTLISTELGVGSSTPYTRLT